MDIKMSSIVISLIAFSLVLMGFLDFYSGMYNHYQNTSSTPLDNLSTLQVYQNIRENTTEKIAAKMQQSQEQSLPEQLGTFFTGALGTLKIFFAIPTILQSLFADTVGFLGPVIPIPNWFISIVLGLISTVVILVIYELFFGRSV